MEIQIPNEMMCPICMILFKSPITIPCGHSYCKGCLLQASKSTQSCPICRQAIHQNVNKIEPDIVLNSIATEFRKASNLKMAAQSQDQIFILIDIKCSSVLIPDAKVPCTFELQKEIVFSKERRWIAKQEKPFDKYGVLIKMISIKHISHNIWEGIAVAESNFYNITEEFIQKENQVAEISNFKSCKAQPIIQKCNLSFQDLNFLMGPFYKLKTQQNLQNFQHKTTINNIIHQISALSMIYSFISILSLSESQKYEIATEFDDQKRLKLLKDFAYSNGMDPNRIFSCPRQTNWKNKLLFIACVAIVIFVLHILKIDINNLQL